MARGCCECVSESASVLCIISHPPTKHNLAFYYGETKDATHGKIATSRGPHDRSRLAAPPACTFAPGDTIIGTVVRKSQLVTPKAILELRLQ